MAAAQKKPTTTRSALSDELVLYTTRQEGLVLLGSSSRRKLF
jgi:hypothetical protein